MEIPIRPNRAVAPSPATRGRCRRLALLALMLLGAPARAELQFDVFLGFDDRIHEGHWFPIAFEILNDGPAFNGTVVVGTEAGIDTQRRSFGVELPTGTRKRIVIPVFSSAGRYSRWEARLLDPDGKVLAERTELQTKDTAPHVPLFGALPRTFGGLPTLPEVQSRAPEFQAGVARLQSDYLPGHPLAWEGLTACYLNSEKAADLKPEQVDALLVWLHDGGHLVVALEQASDANALPWLRGVLPFAAESTTNLVGADVLDRWLATGPSAIPTPAAPKRTVPTTRSNVVRLQRGRVDDPAAANRRDRDVFARLEPQADLAQASFAAVTGRRLDGTTLVAAGDVPLVVSAPRGRGTLTVLTFSPEREPLRTWKNRSWFWAKVISVPTELLEDTGTLRWGSVGLDGLFGAMLDSRQVRKLPVGALLLLLVVYLVVIGPLDQWVLKRLGKQMWTWVTFPLYVVVFSGLIYFIGYRLRAGDLELNELQVVDQLPRGDGAALRGRTWLSIYSPGNARYRMASEQPFATFRAELQHIGPGRADSGRLMLRLPGRGFDAEAYVPVWVNQLFASDWLEVGPPALVGRAVASEGGLTLTLENRSTLRFDAVKVAHGDRIFTLGPLEANRTVERTFGPEEGKNLDEVVASLPSVLGVVQQRRMAFGAEGSGQLDRNLDNVVLASFVQRASGSMFDTGESFVGPAGFDLNPLLARGEVVVLAWASNQGLAAPIHRFSPARQRRDTVLRVSLPGPPPS